MWKSILKILIIFHLLIGLAVDEKCVEKLFVANTKFSLQIKSGNHSNINLLLENIQNEVVNFCILQLISYGISSAFRVCRSLEGRLLLFFKYFTTIEINPLFDILFVYFCDKIPLHFLRFLIVLTLVFIQSFSYITNNYLTCCARNVLK